MHFSNVGIFVRIELNYKTRSSWLNCALRDDEAVCTGSVQDTMRLWPLVIDDTRSVEGLYILHKVEI